jgi:ribosomal protein L16 Arg81 hydroxylase
VNPVSDYFPAKGLFISQRGARTGLHVDPWGSDALLCQMYGGKTWAMYGPDQKQYLQSDHGVVDLDWPNRQQFPDFDKACATFEFTLEPGEILYVPNGWYHAARSDTDSISLTWNFVHRAGVEAFRRWLTKPQSVIDTEILRFFFGGALDGTFSIAALQSLVSEEFPAGAR